MCKPLKGLVYLGQPSPKWLCLLWSEASLGREETCVTQQTWIKPIVAYPTTHFRAVNQDKVQRPILLHL